MEQPYNNISDDYAIFVKAHEEAAQECIPLKPKNRKRIPWENNKVEAKREMLKQHAKNWNKNPTLANKRKFEKARKDLENTYNEEQQNYLQEQIDELQNAAEHQQSATAWQVVNKISGRKNTTKSKLKAANDEERVQKWKNHFYKLLGNAPDIKEQPIEKIIEEELPIKKGDFEMEELIKVVERLKNGKAAGLDNIPPEVWKTQCFNDHLLKYCNNVYNQNNINLWTKGCILPFPKKGDLTITDNYRGITLTCITAKIYNAMIRNRLIPEVNKILRPNQNGFRPHRSTVGQILTVRRILEGVKAKNLQASIIFVDFSKAFDSIHRGKMEEILICYGIPRETVNAIMMLYHNTESMVRSPDGDTGYFTIQAGVLQGDTLAPFLFIIVLDYVLRTSLDTNHDLGLTLRPAKGRRHAAEKLTDADYADDIALLADRINDAEKLLQALEKSAASVGLHVNAKKTEILNINQEGNVRTRNGNQLKEVNNFIYLGSEISSTENDINLRIGKAWNALKSLSKIWKSTLADKMKRNLFRAVVESVLLYGATSWTLTKTLERKLNGTYTRMLRAILNKNWKEHPTKAVLYNGIPPITETIKERRTKYAGHCYRSKEELVSRVLLWIPTHGHTNRGRPRRTYIDQLIGDTGIPVEDLPEIMEERREWRAVCAWSRVLIPTR